jgi:hypothetical protein
MSSTRAASSGSEIDVKYVLMEEKKRKRMVSNRESAKRSRMKKQKMVEDLANEKGRLLRELENNNRLCSEREKGWYAMESENKVLRAEKMSLVQRLRCLHSLIQNLGLSANAPRTLQPIVNPMQLVIASTGKYPQNTAQSQVNVTKLTKLST